MTPRQIAARLFFKSRRDTREMQKHLSVNALAASGDGRTIKEQLDKWEKDHQ